MPDKELHIHHVNDPPRVELGLGLLATSRPWPRPDSLVLTDDQTQTLLHGAFQAGIRWFDTAGSGYDSIQAGRVVSSEARLGQFIQTLTPEESRGITVTTKYGWFLKPDGTYYEAHGIGLAMHSINQSIRRLGRLPDVLFVQRTTSETFKNRKKRAQVRMAILYARARGIKRLGACPIYGHKDAAQTIVRNPLFPYMQMSINTIIFQEDQEWRKITEQAVNAGKYVIVNRVNHAGETLRRACDKYRQIIFDYRFAMENLHPQVPAVILTGTRYIDHLREDIEAFHQARSIY